MHAEACSGSVFPSPSAQSRSEVEECRASVSLHKNVGFIGMSYNPFYCALHDGGPEPSVGLGASIRVCLLKTGCWPPLRLGPKLLTEIIDQ